MGLFWSLLGYSDTGRNDDPDPVTGLTSHEIYLIKNSWAVVRKNPTENGVALLNLMFKNHPEYQQLFPFRDIPLKDLSSNKRYQAHCNAVVYGFSAIVDAVGNSELLVEILRKVGVSHAQRKVGEKEFMGLKDTIIELFSTFMKPNEIETWKKTLNVAFGVVNEAIRNESKQ